MSVYKIFHLVFDRVPVLPLLCIENAGNKKHFNTRLLSG